MAALQGLRGLEGVELARDEDSPLMRISVDAERAAALGLRTSKVGAAVRDAIDGALPTRFMSGAQEYDIRVRLPRADVADVGTLGNLLVFRANGVPARLRDVTTVSLGAGPDHIERDYQSRIVRLGGTFNTEVADIGTTMAEVEARLAALEIPDRLGIVHEGQWQTIQKTNRELLTVVLLALFLVFVVLAVQYEKLSNPFVILSAAPMALIGVVAALALTKTPLSAPVMIGAILLLEYIEGGRRARWGPGRGARSCNRWPSR